MLNKTEQKQLDTAIGQMEAALQNLRNALGNPPLDHDDDHPVTALEVALHHADCALSDPKRYYLKRKA